MQFLDHILKNLAFVIGGSWCGHCDFWQSHGFSNFIWPKALAAAKNPLSISSPGIAPALQSHILNYLQENSKSMCQGPLRCSKWTLSSSLSCLPSCSLSVIGTTTHSVNQVRNLDSPFSLPLAKDPINF